jgi:hypothetical protein
MRLLYTLFILAVGGYGLYWVTDKNPELKSKAEELIDFRTTSALELRYDAHQVMDTHSRRLLQEKGARFLDPELKFFPYLLMEVKYCDAKQETKESLILWDLTDGEMVTDTKTWEKTHGFADCIGSKAQEHEFQILSVLYASGGSADLSTIQKTLGVEMPILEMLLNSCRKKNLIIGQSGSRWRIHLENPRLQRTPETKWRDQLTTRPQKRAQRAKGYFRSSQIEKMAKIAFGNHFSIRKSTEIYLPIHRIVVQDPDGVITTHHFNAVSGLELPPAQFYQ